MVENLSFVVSNGNVELVVNSMAAREIGRMMKVRIMFGREYRMVSKDTVIQFLPGDECSFQVEENKLVVKINKEFAGLLAAVEPVEGVNEWKEFPGFRFVIVPTNIMGQDGTVIRVEGKKE